MLTETENAAIGAAITNMLRLHGAQPFASLREAGAVALLSRELNAAPFDALVEPCLVTSNNRSCLPKPTAFDSRVSRVQLEITVKVESHEQAARSGTPRRRPMLPPAKKPSPWTKTVDIGILSPRPTLRIAPGGAGDVLQQMDAQEMSAAIEVKASPSSDVCQRGLYVSDLLALLWMKREHGIDGHFMLLDRTHSLYGPWGRPRADKAAMVWSNEHRQRIVFRRKGKANLERCSLSECGLSIQDGSVREQTEGVLMWTLDPETKEPKPCRVRLIDESLALTDYLGFPASSGRRGQ